jgi:hypothetical protein
MRLLLSILLVVTLGVHTPAKAEPLPKQEPAKAEPPVKQEPAKPKPTAKSTTDL